MKVEFTDIKIHLQKKVVEEDIDYKNVNDVEKDVVKDTNDMQLLKMEL